MGLGWKGRGLRRGRRVGGCEGREEWRGEEMAVGNTGSMAEKDERENSSAMMVCKECHDNPFPQQNSPNPYVHYHYEER